jgi:hypothetical protein
VIGVKDTSRRRMKSTEKIRLDIGQHEEEHYMYLLLLTFMV